MSILLDKDNDKKGLSEAASLIWSSGSNNAVTEEQAEEQEAEQMEEEANEEFAEEGIETEGEAEEVESETVPSGPSELHFEPVVKPQSEQVKGLISIIGNIMAKVWGLDADSTKEYISNFQTQGVLVLSLLGLDDSFSSLHLGSKLPPMVRMLVAIGVMIILGIILKPRSKSKLKEMK
ncbi:MAG: hypothetical protein QXP36_08035 [Conexivisphaerales archaeon]